MTTCILLKDQIKSHVLRVFSGICFDERKPEEPKLFILSPWISDVKLELSEEVYKLDDMWFGTDYGILPINLSMALLYLKLDFGADIYLITRPPTKKNYSNPAPTIALLDFLDEIGCRIYTNPEIHTKLVLSNDLALVGSFNLTFSALWGNEEIGVSVDDVSNLKELENYANNVVSSSEPYGYTAKAAMHDVEPPSRPIVAVTRGWLFEKLLSGRYILRVPTPSDFHEFLFFHFKTISKTNLLGVVMPDIDGFYRKLILACLTSEETSANQRLRFLRNYFGYTGEHEIGKIHDFLITRLARANIPELFPTWE